MKTCNFSIAQTQPIEQLIDKAKNAIVSAKGTFEGDMEKGKFALSTPVGKIEGNYKVQPDSIVFEITDKPMMLACSMIENQLKKYLEVTE